MSRRREPPLLLLAFGAAVLTHATLVAWLLCVDHGRHDVASRPTVRIAAAPAVVRLPKPNDMPIGEKQGTGDAISRVELPDLTRAPDVHDFEQAWTRQRPSLPSPEHEATPLGPIAPTSPVAALPAKSPPPLKRETIGTIAAPKSDAKPEPPKPDAPREPADQPSKPEATIAENSKPLAASHESKANPGDAGPSDLDAFAKADGVEFTRGGIEPRTGRPVKLARPRVDLRFMADATALAGRSVSIGLRIETDASGAPKDVRVVKSSGSEPIDDAVRLAMYDSWFGGKMPDAFPFGVTLWR